MAAAKGIGVCGLARRPYVKTAALGTEVEFLTGGFVFGADAVGDYADDARSGFDASPHQCFFRVADEGGDENALGSDRFFPREFVSLSLLIGISAAYYGRGYDWMLQQLEIAEEVHFLVEDSDAVGSAE